MDMSHQGSDQTTAKLSQSKEIFPVYIGDQNPHREFRLRRGFQSRDYPVQVMISVEEMLRVETCRKLNPAQIY